MKIKMLIHFKSQNNRQYFTNLSNFVKILISIKINRYLLKKKKKFFKYI